MAVRAFDLVPVLDRSTLNVKIESVDCCGRDLFLGTSEGCIFHYYLDEKVSKRAYSCVKEGILSVGSVKKSICDLRYFSAIERVLALSDHTLFVLSGSTVLHKIKDVVSLSVNENPVNGDPLCIQICVNKERQFHVYSISEEEALCIHKQPCPELLNNLEIDGNYVCVALMSHYAIYNFQNGHQQQLFSFDMQNVKPLVRKVYRGEFLLSGPGGLGIFATTEGISTRPPLNWGCSPLSVCCLHPYVLVLLRDCIQVYSILDQSKKQSIEFHGGTILGNWEGRVLVGSPHCLFALFPVPVHEQIQSLLDSDSLEEAVKIAEGSERHEVIKKTRQQAGFLYLFREDYSAAIENLVLGNTDPREVISLFPGLLGSECSFTRAVPPLHSIPDITFITKGDSQALLRAKQFLLDYLLTSHEDLAKHSFINIVESVLVKLLAELNPSRLQSTIEERNLHCDNAEVVPVLLSRDLYHAAATLMFRSGDENKAFNMWKRILTGELKDETYPGLDVFTNDLKKCKDVKVVWVHAEYVLKRDPEAGVHIFKDFAKFEPDVVVSFLEGYPGALLPYLEYLVYHSKHQREQYHSKLALMYIDVLLSSPEDTATQNSLETLLETSTLYRPQSLLDRLEGTRFHKEQALLFGRLQKHDKALAILVNVQKDYEGAEKYCQTMCTEKYPQAVLHSILLKLYLKSDSEDVLHPMIELLKRCSVKGQLNTEEVLSLLPNNWSLGVLETFLRASLLHCHHEGNRKHIEASLSRQQNLATKLDYYNMKKEAVLLKEHSYCCVCKKSLSGSVFARYPNGVQTHVECAHNPHICPLTGTVFNVTGTS